MKAPAPTPGWMSIARYTSDSLYFSNYYDFRENSFAYQWAPSTAGNARLSYNGPYYYVYGENLAYQSLFGRLLPLVEDFARQSDFRKFYKNNSKFYKKEIKRASELLPVKEMWNWLETQFPKTKYQSYRIILSPLIGGSHSTQRYATYDQNGWFQETVMFVCGADRFDQMRGISAKQREGLMSGIVFTEIDHNYVNPATYPFRATVDSLFAARGIWAKAGASSDFYNNPVSVFNEYMTHSVYCLYVLDHYDLETALYLLENREQLMVNRRNFIRFREFNQEMIRLHQLHPERKVQDLYPELLSWCRAQR